MFHTPLLFDSCAGAKFPDIVQENYILKGSENETFG
jgi:hypothetical protein